MAEVNASSSTIQFTVSEISKLTEAWSPQITLYGIPWKIRVKKHVNGTEKSLGIHLSCDKKNYVPNWSSAASATVKLLSFNVYQQGIVHFIKPFVYDRFYKCYGTNTLIQWNDLINGRIRYVQNDSIKLEVKVEAENPYEVYKSVSNFRCIQQSCECCCQAIYEMTVESVSKLMAVRSTEFTMRGKAYYIIAFKHDNQLSVRLHAHHYSERHNAKMSTILLSSKQNAIPIQRSGGFRAVNIIPWNEMMNSNNGYVNHNSITLKIKINVNDVIDNIAIAEPSGVSRLECLICLNGIDGKDLSSTPCGHWFCTACISKAVRNRAACPKCQKLVQLKDLRRLYL